MTLFRTELRMAITLDNSTGFKKWRTTFYLNKSTAVAAAQQLRDDWIGILGDACRDRVYAYQVYATDMVEGTSNFHLQSILPEDQRGHIPTPDELYAVENCLAVGITVPASRPSRKFWRAGYCESDYTQGVYSNSTFSTLISGKFDDLCGTGQYVDIDGQDWISTLVVKASLRVLGRTSRFDVPNPPPAG